MDPSKEKSMRKLTPEEEEFVSKELDKFINLKISVKDPLSLRVCKILKSTSKNFVVYVGEKGKFKRVGFINNAVVDKEHLVLLGELRDQYRGLLTEEMDTQNMFHIGKLDGEDYLIRILMCLDDFDYKSRTYASWRLKARATTIGSMLKSMRGGIPEIDLLLAGKEDEKPRKIGEIEFVEIDGEFINVCARLEPSDVIDPEVTIQSWDYGDSLDPGVTSIMIIHI